MDVSAKHNSHSNQASSSSVASLNPFEFLPHAAIACDASGHILHANALAAALLGPDCIQGKDLRDVCRNKLSDADGVVLDFDQTPFVEALSSGCGFHGYKLLINDPRNTWHLYSVDIAPLKPNGSDIIGALITFTVPEGIAAAERANPTYSQYLEQANRELIDAREASLNASAAKSEFLSNMSHELRTPMNAVIGMAEVLWETELSEEQRKLLSVLMRGGRNLLAIIDDVLDYSRLESGQLPMNREEFDLGQAVERTLDLVRPLAESKSLQLKLSFDCESRMVLGDEKKLGQVLINLIGNAIKFTKQGSVTIRVSDSPSNPGTVNDHVLFQVIDTGIGIATEKLGELFKRFTQADMGVTKDYGGTGLGLAISKQLVKLMDGDIWVTSEPGHGTTFSFTVKLAAAKADSATAAIQAQTKPMAQTTDQSNLAGLRILVVEDSKDNAFLIANYLKNIGSTLDFAGNGQEAIEMFQRASYDLILMDMQMPVMDGYSATRWIRILEKPRGHRTPIIALTAYAMDEEVKKSFDAGCDAHLNKPLSKRLLLNTIAEQVDAIDGNQHQPRI